MNVGPVTIAWYQGTAWQSAFEIQVSLDDTTWTPVFAGRSSGQTLQPERYDFPTVTARYVRIVGHGQWSGTTLLSLWNSITEVAISGSAPVVDPVPVAVFASGYQDPNVPQNTLDNNLGTRWSANDDGQWIRYDLGSTMNVGPVTIAWYQGTAWQSAFEIQVSLDSITWTSVYSGRSSGQTLQPERYDFPSATGRYVRLGGHGQWSGTTLLSAWNSITEVVIYDSPDSPAGSITPLPVASVTVSPASVSLSVGQTLLLSVVLKDSAGDFLTDRTVTWTTSNSAVATVSASGLVTGVTVGTATITATSRGVSGKAATSVASTTSGGAGPQPGPTDPIILQDGFESGDLNSWTQDPAAGRYSLSTDPTRVHSGNSSLQALYTPTNGYGLITRWFMPGYDEVYVKFYVMFQAGFENMRNDGNGMHFFTLCGNNVNNNKSCWGQPGVVPNGTDFFYAGLDPAYVQWDPTLRPFSFYTYWPDMSCCYGNLFFQSPPQIALVGGQWQEVVFHIKLNTIGQSDGSQDLWINGVKVISGQNMRWRTTTDLRLNEIIFFNYMPGGLQTQDVWVDDLTVWRP